MEGGVSISPGLGLIPGCDRQTDTELRQLVRAPHYVLLRVKIIVSRETILHLYAGDDGISSKAIAKNSKDHFSKQCKYGLGITVPICKIMHHTYLS